ncbi:MAG: hypothetical protein OK439_00350 [Thaumarchaeota archaeon]|nr:hypothetical protein [Nitrososphaerota archaeon]
MPDFTAKSSGSSVERSPSKRQDLDILCALLRHFSEDGVEPEWNIGKDAEDIFQRDNEDFSPKYVPRLDFAVGPFNRGVNPFDHRDIRRRARNETVGRLLALNDAQHRDLTANENPRCLLAVEVESSTGRKHRMGSILNASFIGYYGIVVAKASKGESEDKIYESLTNIRTYIEVMKVLRKTQLILSNVVIAKKSSLIKALR